MPDNLDWYEMLLDNLNNRDNKITNFVLNLSLGPTLGKAFDDIPVEGNFAIIRFKDDLSTEDIIDIESICESEYPDIIDFAMSSNTLFIEFES